jgi:hypothetical protein
LRDRKEEEEGGRRRRRRRRSEQQHGFLFWSVETVGELLLEFLAI